MAGACPASLSIAVANAGGLGACGVLLMQPDEIKIWARDVRAGSNGSFQLNNWIPDPPPARDSVHEARVREFLGHWGPTVAPEAGEAATPDFAAQCEAMLDADPRIISSIMGLYPEEFVAKMKARQAGTIINIIGMGGRAVRPDYICGAAGNAALIGFTNALGAETPGYNVRVFGINPAATMTDRIVALSKARAKARFGDESRWEEVLNAAKLPFGRIKSADEVAALATMLASAKVHYLSGIVIDMDGGGQWRNA